MKLCKLFLVLFGISSAANSGSFFNKEKGENMDTNDVKEYVSDKANYLSDMTSTQWDKVKAKSKQLKGHAKELYGKLTNDELMQIEGKKDRFMGYIISKYGYTKAQANKAWQEMKESAKE